MIDGCVCGGGGGSIQMLPCRSGETGSSCYTGKLLQLRFLYKKLEGSSSQLSRMKSIRPT